MRAVLERAVDVQGYSKSMHGTFILGDLAKPHTLIVIGY